MTSYTDLEARFRRLGAVEEAIAVLHWDAAAMMPPGGAAIGAARDVAWHRASSADRAGDHRSVRSGRRRNSRARGVAARQSARDAAALAACSGRPARSRRGDVAGLLRVRDDMAPGVPGR